VDYTQVSSNDKEKMFSIHKAQLYDKKVHKRKLFKFYDINVDRKGGKEKDINKY